MSYLGISKAVLRGSSFWSLIAVLAAVNKVHPLLPHLTEESKSTFPQAGLLFVKGQRQNAISGKFVPFCRGLVRGDAGSLEVRETQTDNGQGSK